MTDDIDHLYESLERAGVIGPKRQPELGQCEFTVNDRRCERQATRVLEADGERLALCDDDYRDLEASNNPGGWIDVTDQARVRAHVRQIDVEGNVTDERWVDITDRPEPPFPAQSIELDCPPGDPRPGDLLPELLVGTGLPVREARSKVFGNWTWDYSDIPETTWQAAKPLLKQRIEALHARGLIRYGSW